MSIYQISTETVSTRLKIAKLCNEKGYSHLSMQESQWKLRQQHQNFPVEGMPLYNRY